MVWAGKEGKGTRLDEVGRAGCEFSALFGWQGRRWRGPVEDGHSLLHPHLCCPPGIPGSPVMLGHSRAVNSLYYGVRSGQGCTVSAWLPHQEHLLSGSQMPGYLSMGSLH